MHGGSAVSPLWAGDWPRKEPVSKRVNDRVEALADRGSIPRSSTNRGRMSKTKQVSLG